MRPERARSAERDKAKVYYVLIRPPLHKVAGIEVGSKNVFNAAFPTNLRQSHVFQFCGGMLAT